ncbi:MAG: circadian clock KaiB family protein [Fimbriimonas sp.]
MDDYGDESLLEFERALANRGTGDYRLRLYVSGSTPRSSKAVANVRALCERHLAGRYELEVVDLYQEPHRAKECQVIAAPTLVREQPIPTRRVIGDMSNEEKLLLSLEIAE